MQFWSTTYKQCVGEQIPHHALVQVMAWRRKGDKPLSEAMLVYSTDTYMRHSASMR